MRINYIWIDYNNIQDVREDHINAIYQSILKSGWVGAPIIVYGEEIITGNHRYTACKRIFDETEINHLQTINIETIIVNEGLDLNDFIESEDNYMDWLDENLSEATKEKYGFDYQ